MMMRKRMKVLGGDGRSAAPTYFAPTTMENRSLADGALCTNNPSSVLLADFFKLQKIEHIHGIVSALA